MKRSKREAARESAEKLKQCRKSFKEREHIVSSDKEKSFYKAIEWSNIKKKSTPENEFMQVIAKKAPKLLDDESYQGIVDTISKMDLVRPVAEWKPKGKGKQTLLASLASHVLAEYSIPKFLWNSFWEEDWASISVAISAIAKGKSFAKLCKEGSFPVPLNKKQCHQLLQSSASDGFISAVRRVQIQTHGGEPRLHSIWMKETVGQRVCGQEQEAFWDTVIAWFCKHPMLDPSQIKPLIDFIGNRHEIDETFSMKGRSPMAMIRAMEVWHEELHKQKIFRQHNYSPSGFRSGQWEYKVRTKTGHQHKEWKIKEILTSKELHEEGKAHSHCVASYGRSISNGLTSIWSMTCNGERMITIEVRNSSKRIVQARGRYNRVTTNEEFKIISSWAQENNLDISIGIY